MQEIQTDWLKGRKKALKINDAHVADKIGRDRSIVNKLFNGKQRLDIEFIDGLADALQVTPEEILYRFGVLEVLHPAPPSHPPLSAEHVKRLVSAVMRRAPKGGWTDQDAEYLAEVLEYALGLVPIANATPASDDAYAVAARAAIDHFPPPSDKA